MRNMTKILECKNIHKNFGHKEVLKDVSFSMEAGEIFGFIGPNGAGKTTTIKLILGLQKITSETIKINGKDVEKDFTEAISQVGAIVENPDLYMYLSGRKNLELVARMYKGISKERIDEVIALVGMEKRIDLRNKEKPDLLRANLFASEIQAEFEKDKILIKLKENS